MSGRLSLKHRNPPVIVGVIASLTAAAPLLSD
jgi:hypothetical protein